MTRAAKTAKKPAAPRAERRAAKPVARKVDAGAIEKTIAGRQIGDVLLPYQKRLFQAASTEALLVYEKSRRIGITWAIASSAVLTAAKARTSAGMDVLYLGYALDMTREFIDTCAAFARAIEPAAASVQEFVFDDGSEKGIGAFRIKFGSGFEIVALTSKPRSLRGRQGFVIIDEAAFHDELDEVLKAALALLIWGGRVAVISSHNGDQNPFNALIQDIRAGKRKGTVLRTTFDEALADGLYERVCYVRGLPYSKQRETEWRAEIYGFYGSAAEEELDVIPSKGTGSWLPRVVLEQRTVDVPVLRLVRTPKFTFEPDAAREADIDAWLTENIAPLVAKLHPHAICAFGEDFGREVDRSVIWPVQRQEDLTWLPPFVIEMVCVPFEQQRQVLFYVCDALGPRLVRGALDANGNGAWLAERAAQRYGSRIEQVKLSETWYREHMPKLKSGLEQASFPIPKDADIVDDFSQLKLIKGVARLPDGASRIGRDGLSRHADSAIAGALACFAAYLDPVEYGYEPVPKPKPAIASGGRGLQMRESEFDDAGTIGRFGGGTF